MKLIQRSHIGQEWSLLILLQTKKKTRAYTKQLKSSIILINCLKI